MRYSVSLGDQRFEVTVEGDRVTVEGRGYQAELRPSEDYLRTLSLDGRTWTVPLEAGLPGTWIVTSQGDRYEVEVLDERSAQLRALVRTATAQSGPQSLKAPMPGLVVKVLATPGEKVVQGESLIVLEAMKMQNELKAAATAIVDAVKVAPGRAVEKGEVLITFRN